MSRYEIVTICGSTKFKDDMMRVAKELTLENKIVLMPLVFAHKGDKITDKQKENLDKLHLSKIDLSDTVVIVTVDDYIGESTKNEIIYAIKKGKNVQYKNTVSYIDTGGFQSNYNG